MNMSQKVIKKLTDSPAIARLLVMMVGSFTVMSIIKPSVFLSGSNFSSMAFQFPEYGIMSIGMMLAIITGGIDLSLVGVANMAGVIAALVMAKLQPFGAAVGLNIATAIIAALLVAATAGFINGFLIAEFKIPPILVTLGSQQLFSGIALVITKGPAITGLPESYVEFGNGTIWIFPIPFVAFAVIAVIIGLILHWSVYGRQLKLMGTNAIAAKFSAIPNFKITVQTYMMSALFAGVAGLIMIARTASAKADYGTSYTLQTLLIAILGGVDPEGGEGSVAGVVFAIFTLQFLSSGFNMLQVSNFFKQFVWGAVLIIVMVINYRKSTARN